MWQYHLMKGISKIICLLPKMINDYIGDFLGIVAWIVMPTWRKNLAIDQVRQCLSLPYNQAEKIAKNSATKYGKMLVEVLAFPLLTKESIKNKVVFHDEDKKLFDSLLAEGKGLILATAHFGNWEIGAALALYGYPLVAVVQKLRNDAMDKFINEYRSMIGEHVVYKAGVLEMARMLGKGNVVGLLYDQDAGKDGVVVDFLGRPSSCPKGPAALARLKDAPIVVMLLNNKDDGTYEISLSEKIVVSKSNDRESDIKETTQVLMKKLEVAIREQPEMWFWLHNRWKVDKQRYKTKKQA